MIPEGFLFSGLNCGLRRDRNDLGLIIGEDILDAVCYFTENSYKAAPVIASINAIEDTGAKIKAVIVNSGNANCATGDQGLEDVFKICNTLSSLLDTDGELVHSSSTGIIGKRLDADKIIAALPALIEKASHEDAALNEFSRAIMTTDLVPKIVTKRVKFGSDIVTVTGVAKGSGMIQPMMSMHATMLAYVITDACVSHADMKSITKGIIESSFNSITVDGCCSTNDSVFFLNSSKVGQLLKGDDLKKFESALNALCFELAQMIVKDGEGATKCITVTVKGAKSQKTAKEAGLTIANSMLVKTAIYGSNPNLGRITQILGQYGFVDSTWKQDVKLLGLDTDKVDVIVDLAQGKASWNVLTCDLTEDYIKINAEYN